ncbi:MAG: glycosyltransferase family 2 protein [Candidatus Saganbacteria bacterium]|nr:glycosyltransferase family 2 protein [Candidatus Saganbacteria bacterium]
MPLFSVIIPVFNAEKDLEAAVNSILRQEYTDCEIIIVDDASTDDSGLIADKLSANTPKKIKVIHNTSRSGVGTSRNIGLSAVKGDYIIFLDADDMLMGDCLNGLTQLIRKCPGTDLIVARWKKDGGAASNSRLFEDTSLLNSSDPIKLVAHMNEINWLNYVCWHYIVERKFLLEKRLRFINAWIAEDQEFVTKLLCLAASVAYFNHTMYLYRGTGVISKSMDLLTSVGFVKIVISLAHFLKNNPQFKEEQKKFILSRIKSVSGMLTGRLTLLNEAELEGLEEFIGSSARKAHEIHDIFKALGLFYLIEKGGQGSSVLNIMQEVENSVLSIVSQVKCKKLYIFCASIDASSTGSILLKNGYHVLGLVDNNPAFNRATQNKFFVYGPEVFSSKNREDNHDCAVIVCHQSVEMFDKIARQLMQYGLVKENIRHLKPKWAIVN